MSDEAEEQAIALDGELAARYCSGFMGYGSLSSPMWCIGMEEGCVLDPVQELSVRLDLWSGSWQEAQTIDLVTFHGQLEEKGARQPNFFRPDAPRFASQTTWRALIRFAEATEERTGLDAEDVKAIQATRLGRHGTDAGLTLLELLPLPNRSLADWGYSDNRFSPALPEMASRRKYQGAWLPKRAAKLRELIDVHRPRAVLMYGLGYRTTWESVCGPLTRIPELDAFAGSLGDSSVILAKGPSAFGVTSDYWERLGSWVRAQAIS